MSKMANIICLISPYSRLLWLGILKSFQRDYFDALHKLDSMGLKVDVEEISWQYLHVGSDCREGSKDW